MPGVQRPSGSESATVHETLGRVRGAASSASWARAAAAALGLGLLALSAVGEPDPRRVFDLPGGRVTSVIVTASTTPPSADALGSPMLRALEGVVADLAERDIARLRTMVRAATAAPTLERADLVGIMHLENPGASKRVEILRVPGVGLVASEVDPIDPEGQPATAVLPEAFGSIVAAWDPYRGGFGLPDVPLGEPVDLAHPYTPSPITFDQELMSDRFAGGAGHNVRSAVRDLDAETIWVRLPAAYDPRRPAGLLVWLDPSDSGRPPEFMHPAADEHNLVIVGAANAGNDRMVSDRHQLAFDAVATARSRFHIDASRIYAVGVSGGGRVASMQWGCFPDVFAGAVSIVGLSSYRTVAVGGGHIPAGYAIPRQFRELLRHRRLAAITGPRDANYTEIVEAQRLMDLDRYPVRVFSYDDMGHEYPTPERFSEALEWVDEAWGAARAEAERLGQRQLDAFLQRRGEDVAEPLAPAQRDALVRITQVAPWTPAAWEAAELLGFRAPGEGDAGR